MLISIRRSRDALLALAFFVLMVLVVFSTLLYFAERGTWDESLETFIDDDGQRSAFESIPAAAWFVLVSEYTWILPFPELATDKFSSYNHRRLWRDHSSVIPRSLDHNSTSAIRIASHRAPVIRPRSRICDCMGGNGGSCHAKSLERA